MRRSDLVPALGHLEGPFTQNPARSRWLECGAANLKKAPPAEVRNVSPHQSIRFSVRLGESMANSRQSAHKAPTGSRKLIDHH